MIGKWIARFVGDKPLTLAHYCESEIGDRKVINCGRQMHPTVVGYRSEIREAPDVLKCRRCLPAITATQTYDDRIQFTVGGVLAR